MFSHDSKVVINLNLSRLAEISDPFLREKWKLSEANIKSETQQVMVLLDLCNTFKAEFQNNNKADREEDNNNILMRDYVERKDDRRPSNNINMVRDQQKANDKRWERFGGKAPFSKEEDENDNMDVDFSSERANKIRGNQVQPENVMVYKKPISSSVEKKDKDPMVWDPPEDRNKINNVNKNKKVPTQPIKGVKKDLKYSY